ncbi:MAG: ArsR family transcriptional regulator [Bacteroidales bacterium]|nr:ArsR family transcriptional regulator [Bacteroidales bacterium]
MQNKELEQKVIDKLNASFKKLVESSSNDMYRDILGVMCIYLTESLWIHDNRFWKHIPTFGISNMLGMKTSVIRCHLNKMEKEGLVRSYRSSNNILWSVENLEGFPHSQYKDYYEIIDINTIK